MQGDVVKHQWQQIRRAAKQWWVDLTDEDLQHIEGDREQLLDLLQRKCGYTRQQAEWELDRRISDYERFAV